MDLGLKGLRAVVTGGTRGIGLKIAETLAAEGVNVAICSRNAAEAQEVAKSLEVKGVAAMGSSVDVGDAAALSAWVTAVAAAFGGLDIVISNVSALAVGNNEAAWKSSFEIDMMGTVRLVECALPYLEKSEAASIVTI